MRDSIDSTRLGTNRTGMQMAPQQAKEMLDNTELDVEGADIDTNGQGIAEMRADYIREADPL